MKRNPNIGELVLVDWDDAFIPEPSVAWHSVDDLGDLLRSRHYEAQSVGWVVHVDARSLTISGSRVLSDEEIGRLERIPRGCIRKITLLRKR